MNALPSALALALAGAGGATAVPLPARPAPPFDGLRLRLVTSLLAAPPPTSRSAPCECHKTRFLGRGQQHLRGVPVVPCGPNSRVTQPRTAMSAGNLAHLIDFGVGKEEDRLLDNSFAATRPAPETLTTTTSPTMPIS